MTSGLKSDRRLYLTADKSRVVEEGCEGAWLFASAGCVIPYPEADAYGLECRDGKVILPQAAAEPKAVKKPEDKSLKRGGDKSRAAPRTVASPRSPDQVKL